MIVHRPADLDPVMKSALKNHIMRKRQQLKQEMEQDAIEKRLKREHDAKIKQDAMTLDQLKDQLTHLEKNLDSLKNEKQNLFAKLKQNIRVLNEDGTKRKQKEEEENNSSRSQQNESNHIQEQQSTSNGPNQSISNQENHIPSPRDKNHDIQNQHAPQPIPFHPQQTNSGNNNNQPEHDTPSVNSHQNSNHIQRSNTMFKSPALSHFVGPHGVPRQSQFLNHPPPPQSMNRIQNPYGPSLSQYSQLSHHNSAPQLGPGIPTSLSHAHHTNPMIRPSPPPPSMSNNPVQMNSVHSKMPLSMPPITAPGSSQADFASSLATSTAHQLQQQALTNPVAAAAALGLPFPYFNTGSPLGLPMSTHQSTLEHHHAAFSAAAVAAAAAASHNLMGGNGVNSNAPSNNMNIGPNSSRSNSIPSMKRPISATNMQNDTLSPNKKLHAQSSLQTQQQPQLPVSLANPYLPYPGMGGGPGTSCASSIPAGLFSPGLIRTPPPPSISSLFNQQALSHLMSAQAFPRQSPFLSPMPQSNRGSNPFGPLGQFSAMGHHPGAPSGLLAGHPGIPTSLSHAHQPNPLIRPSPPPMSVSLGNQLGGAHPSRGPLNPSMTNSGPPGQLDFGSSLATSTAHQLQQHQAALAGNPAAAAALGLPFAYFGTSSPLGLPLPSHQSFEHHAALNAAAAAVASGHNLVSGGNNPNGSNSGKR